MSNFIMKDKKGRQCGYSSAGERVSGGEAESSMEWRGKGIDFGEPGRL